MLGEKITTLEKFGFGTPRIMDIKMSKRSSTMHKIGSGLKIKGHNNEKDFNERFGDKDAKIYYSGASSDCTIKDKWVLRILKNRLKTKGPRVSLKGGKTIQIHLGKIPELTNFPYWKSKLCKTKKGETTSQHGISFSEQKAILNRKDFWLKYLGKNSDILCFRADTNKWIFFNMSDVVDFTSRRFDWRLLDTGRLKGNCDNKQILTYEYRPEKHKDNFVLGAHGDSNGTKFIDILMRYIPFEEIKR